MTLHASLEADGRRASAEIRGIGDRHLVRLRWESLTGSVVDERAEVFPTTWECLSWLRAGEGVHPHLAEMAGELAAVLSATYTETANT